MDIPRIFNITESAHRIHNRSHPKSSPPPARRCVWKREPERYAAYTLEYLGWSVFVLMTR
jgi:hypothetical protein